MISQNNNISTLIGRKTNANSGMDQSEVDSKETTFARRGKTRVCLAIVGLPFVRDWLKKH